MHRLSAPSHYDPALGDVMERRLRRWKGLRRSCWSALTVRVGLKTGDSH